MPSVLKANIDPRTPLVSGPCAVVSPPPPPLAMLKWFWWKNHYKFNILISLLYTRYEYLRMAVPFTWLEYISSTRWVGKTLLHLFRLIKVINQLLFKSSAKRNNNSYSISYTTGKSITFRCNCMINENRLVLMFMFNYDDPFVGDWRVCQPVVLSLCALLVKSVQGSDRPELVWLLSRYEQYA